MTEQEKKEQDQHYISKFEVYFLFSIDLSQFCDKQSAKEILDLRAKREIYERTRSFKDIGFSFCNTGDLESENIVSRVTSTLRVGGKNIWAPIFLEKYAPVRFKENKNEDLCESIPVEKGQMVLGKYLLLEEYTDKEVLQYKGCEIRFFREGILSLGFHFSSLGNGKIFLSVTDFIRVLSKLRSCCSDGFKSKTIRIFNFLREQKNSWSFAISSSIPKETIEKYIDELNHYHTVIFIDSLYQRDKEGDRYTPAEVGTTEQYKRDIFGLLNQPRWFKKYGERYIEAAFQKNIGYRKDEIYITDNNCTLILLEEYWEPSTPLVYYRRDLVLLVEYILSRLSMLEYLNSIIHSQELTDSLILNKPDGKQIKGIEYIVQIRNILFALEESMDVGTIIKHGFTRKFLSQVINERYIQNQIKAIEGFVDNLDKAITLKSSSDLAASSNKIAEKSTNYAKWSLVIAIVVTIISLVSFTISISSCNSKQDNAALEKIVDELKNIKQGLQPSPAPSPSPTAKQ